MDIGNPSRCDMHKPHEGAHALTHSQAIHSGRAEPKLCTYCGKCGYSALVVITKLRDTQQGNPNKPNNYDSDTWLLEWKHTLQACAGPKCSCWIRKTNRNICAPCVGCIYLGMEGSDSCWPRYRLLIMPSSPDLSEPIKRSHDICFEPTLTENNQINGILMRQNTIAPVICLHTTPRRRLSEREAGGLAQIAEHMIMSSNSNLAKFHGINLCTISPRNNFKS